MSTKVMQTNLTGAIQYLIEWDSLENQVPLSVFFHDDGQGMVHGLYFGYAGSGCWDDAYFRMVIGEDGHVHHFLECDDPSYGEFRLDKVAGDGTIGQMLPLNDKDARIFTMLGTYRASWWRFSENGDDEIRIMPARLKQLLVGSEAHLRSARSTSLDMAVAGRISRYWSLGTTITLHR